MKIQLLAGIGGFPTGSVHRVIQIIPHGGHTDDPHQYLIQGQVYVPSSKAIKIPDATPGANEPIRPIAQRHVDRFNDIKAIMEENQKLKVENAQLYADLYALRDDWENAQLTISSLKGEVADLRFEADQLF